MQRFLSLPASILDLQDLIHSDSEDAVVITATVAGSKAANRTIVIIFTR
jgi:hypothetical protein